MCLGWKVLVRVIGWGGIGREGRACRGKQKEVRALGCRNHLYPVGVGAKDRASPVRVIPPYDEVAARGAEHLDGGREALGVGGRARVQGEEGGSRGHVLIGMGINPTLLVSVLGAPLWIGVAFSEGDALGGHLGSTPGEEHAWRARPRGKRRGHP